MKIPLEVLIHYFSTCFPLDISSVNSVLERCLKLRNLYLQFSVMDSRESIEVMNTCMFTPLLY